MVARKELLQRDEVVIRLTHLLTVDGQHVVVHPVLDGGMTHRGLSLGYLTLMVWKHEVHAATVDIELLAQILTSHRCTFAVPARESVTPR